MIILRLQRSLPKIRIAISQHTASYPPFVMIRNSAYFLTLEDVSSNPLRKQEPRALITQKTCGWSFIKSFSSTTTTIVTDILFQIHVMFSDNVLPVYCYILKSKVTCLGIHISTQRQKLHVNIIFDYLIIPQQLQPN